MILFNCDYNEGAHPRILEKMMETNMEQTYGYGKDPHCFDAAVKILNACGSPQGDVHFLVGGTQANVTVITSILKHYQGVICAESGHINVHETGALEACGHKCLTLPSEDGKITAAQVENYARAHYASDSVEHTVQPKMVYISNSTELGTIYKKQELLDLYETCKEFGLYLFMDGARMGYALASEENDMTLEDIAANTDVFYIGGTKNGALFGEAVVITNPMLREDFRYNIKQRGGMLAKGRLLGIQFETLFEDDLYMELARHADAMASKIKSGLKKMNVQFKIDTTTNQLFPILPDVVLEELRQQYGFDDMGRVDEHHTAVRICTSWATQEEHVDALMREMQRILAVKSMFH